MAPEDRTGIQVIARAAEILHALEQESSGLSLSEIAARVELPRSTVQRIVNALLDEQFLMPASHRGRVKLGPALVRLGRAADVEVASIVRPYVQELSRTLGETVDLSTLRRSSAVFIEQAAGSHRLAAISKVGTVFPLHSTANGKALLACLSQAQRAKLLVRPLSKDTSATVTDPRKLEREIETVQRTGLAYDLEEHTEGVCAIGTSFFDAAGRPYALSIPVPKRRYEQTHEKLTAALLDARDRIVKQIDGSLLDGVGIRDE